MKKRLAMAVAACAMLAANAATNITGSVSLTADADWTEFGLVTVESGATLDLNGNTLTVAGIDGQGSIVSSFANIATDTSKASSTSPDSAFYTETTGIIAGPNCAFESDNRVLMVSNNWPMVIIYDFSDPTLIDTYHIVNFWGANETVRAPGSWSLSGSSDNISWTELDTRTKITTWAKKEVKSFDFENFTKYRYYKIEITESANPANSKGNYIQFLQLQYGRKGRVAVTGAASTDTTGLTIASNVVAELSSSTTLSADCDLSGFGSCTVADSATADLNGHDLTVSSLSGGGTITDTLATSNLTGSGTASCSDGITSIDTDATADRAFENENRVIVEKTYWPFSVTYDFGEATVVDMYGIVASGKHVYARAPGVWELCGSADGDAWTTLDRRSGVTNWTADVQNDFDFVNTNAYRYYKIEIAEPVDPSKKQGIYIEFWQLKYGRRSELRVNVPSGVETTNTVVTLAGSLRLVKEGGGTLEMAKTAQGYAGGTVVADGTLRCGAAGSSNALGAAGGIVGVAAGATLDMNGQLGYSAYRLALAGGTLYNAVEQGWKASGMIGDIALFADSFFTIDADTFIGSSDTTHTLDLGGHTFVLAMDSSATPTLRLYNAVVKDGTIDIGDRGVLLVGGSGVTATNADFSVQCGLNMDQPFAVRNYESTWDRANGNKGSATMSVYGAFKPTTDYFYGCQLMDGATLDLSARETVLNAQSLCTGGNRVISFEENATVGVSLGSRRVSSDSAIVSWTSETKPANVDTVKFVCVDDDRKCALLLKDDGLYYSRCGLRISVR